MRAWWYRRVGVDRDVVIIHVRPIRRKGKFSHLLSVKEKRHVGCANERGGRMGNYAKDVDSTTWVTEREHHDYAETINIPVNSREANVGWSLPSLCVESCHVPLYALAAFGVAKQILQVDPEFQEDRGE